MPYANIYWIKLHLKLLNDKRFIFDCNYEQKWLFIGLLLLAGSTSNKVPNDVNYIKNRLNLPCETVKISQNIDKLLSTFPKLVKSGNYLKFNNFIALHNRVGDSQRNSDGTPMVHADKIRIDKIRTDKIREYFVTSYKRLFNTEYIWSFGKDSKLLKDLLLAMPDDVLIKSIDRFFKSTDTFIINAGYTFGVFKSVINKLNSQAKEPFIEKLYE